MEWEYSTVGKKMLATNYFLKNKVTIAYLADYSSIIIRVYLDNDRIFIRSLKDTDSSFIIDNGAGKIIMSVNEEFGTYLSKIKEIDKSKIFEDLKEENPEIVRKITNFSGTLEDKL